MAEKPPFSPASFFSLLALLALGLGALQSLSFRCGEACEARRLAVALRPDAEAALTGGDAEKAVAALDALRSRPSYAAALYKADGQLVAGWPKVSRPGHPAPPLPGKGVSPAFPGVQVAAPLGEDGTLFLNDEIGWGTFLLHGAGAALGVLVGALLVFALRREQGSAARPDPAADDVAAALRDASAAAARSDYRARIAARGPLAEAFNELLGALGRRETEREAERLRADEQAQALRAQVTRLEKERGAAPSVPAALPVESAFDLGGLLEEVASVLTVRAGKRRLGFSLETVGLLPVVRGDEAALRRLLLDLGGNAVRFTEKGRIDLVAGAIKGNDRFRFELRDTAGPLPAVGAEGEPRFTGGLAEAERQIVALGGTLRFRANEGGNAFWFDLDLPASSV